MDVTIIFKNEISKRHFVREIRAEWLNAALREFNDYDSDEIDLTIVQITTRATPPFTPSEMRYHVDAISPTPTTALQDAAMVAALVATVTIVLTLLFEWETIWGLIE